jgi:leader peptidase (prepilin peptidase)/N-methyltransferase
MMSPAAWAGPAAALGLVFGSFVGALSYRLPRGVSIARGRSRCPHCGHDLQARDLVPVLSWVAAKGRCRHCGASISARYPVIEITSMLLFVAAVLFVHDAVALGVVLALTPIALTLAVIDVEHARLPNGLIAALALLLVVWRWHSGGAVLLGVAAAVGIAAALFTLAAQIRHVNPIAPALLGAGDAKLLAITALALPPAPYALFLALAGALGVVCAITQRWRTGRTQFPFGPALLLSLWLVLVAGLLVVPSVMSAGV